jgi:hypothetical protein
MIAGLTTPCSSTARTANSGSFEAAEPAQHIGQQIVAPRRCTCTHRPSRLSGLTYPSTFLSDVDGTCQCKQDWLPAIDRVEGPTPFRSATSRSKMSGHGHQEGRPGKRPRAAELHMLLNRRRVEGSHFSPCTRRMQSVATSCDQKPKCSLRRLSVFMYELLM